MYYIFSGICIYFEYLTMVLHYLKLYAIFFFFVFLYKPKVLAVVLFFIVLYFLVKKKKVFENDEVFVYYENSIGSWLRFFRLYSATHDKNFFFKNYKKNNRLFIYSFTNFFLLLFAFVFFFTLIFFFIFYFFYDISHFNYLSNWTVYSCQLLSINFDWLVYLDALALYFIILTTFIFFLVFLNLFSLKFKKDYKKNYASFKLLLFLLFYIEICLVLTFSTSNIFFFFFFFEASLIPLYILVQIWGRGLKKKQYAMFSLLFFTLTGSIFLLCGILLMFNFTNCVDFRVLTFEKINFSNQILLFILFFLGFAFKAPMFPFYSWLPEAHVEASTSVSILLAAIFLKIASYGILRMILFNLSSISFYFHSFIVFINIFSILSVFFIALTQTDLKKIIALSSIGHMNYIIIGLFSFEPKAVLGSLIYMGAHALISSALFMLIGIMYENTNSRDLFNFFNLKNYNSRWSFFFLLFNLANVSFPGFISFFCELIIFNNITFFNILILILIVFALFFSAIYTFWIIHNVLYGKMLKKNYFLLSKNEILCLSLLLFAIFLFGFFPFILLKNLEQDIYLLLIKSLFNV